MKILCCSKALQPWLDGACLPVHSSFESGINLDLGGRLAFVGNKLGELLPGGLLLSPADVPILTAAAVPSETCFSWDPQRQALCAGTITLELEGTDCFDCRLSPAPLSLSLALFDQCVNIDAPTGLGLSIKELSNLDRPETAALCQCLRAQNPEGNAVLRRWVGRGPGLTPSGDDFITGLLAVHAAAPFLSAAFLDGLLELIQLGWTTDTSVSYYRWALEGQFPRSVVQLLEALRDCATHNSAHVAAHCSAEQVERFGHSSGRDLLAGVRLGLALMAPTEGALLA